MKHTVLLTLPFLFFSCFGDDGEDLLIRLSVGIGIDMSVEDPVVIDSDAENSLDRFFAVGLLTVDGSLSGQKTQYMTIEFDDKKSGVYFFDSEISAKMGERVSLTFVGYYYIDDSIIGGFTSESPYYIDVRDGMSTDISIDSIDMQRTRMTIEVGDSSVNKIILMDSQTGIFLRSISRSTARNVFYQEIPEGTYDIYSIGSSGSKILLKKHVGVEGESIKVEL